MLTGEIKKYIDKSVLCWLATSSQDNIPNVSPKEIFTHYGTNRIIIANIASPQSVRNIIQNQNVCISFVDILVQKGFQLKGSARIVRKNDSDFSKMEEVLVQMTDGKFPFASIIEVHIQESKPIIAPMYILCPDTTEEEQIESARSVYGL